MSVDQNKAIVRRFLEEVWGKGNINLLRDLVTPDVTDHNPGPGQPCGYEGQEWATRTFLKGVSNTSINVEQLVGQGDFVVDRWTYSGTQTGEFFGLPATGRKFTITGTDMSRVANGKIAEIWHVEDMLGLMQQIGAAPTPQGLPREFGRPASATTRPSGTGFGGNLSDDDKKDLIRTGIRQLLDQGDLRSAETFLTPDYVGHFSGFPTVYGIDGFNQFLSIYTNGLSNRHTDIGDFVVEGDRVACRVTYHGKNTGNMFNMPPTGKQTDVPSLIIFRLVGNKVAEQWANNSDLLMMQQLGVVPVQAGAEAPVPC